MEKNYSEACLSLLPEGVMFLTEKQILAKQEEEMLKRKERFEVRINSLKRESYPDGTLFGIAIHTGWDSINREYKFLDCTSFEEAKEILFKEFVDRDRDYIIAYVRKPVTIMKEVLV